jgi:hypothetical protein
VGTRAIRSDAKENKTSETTKEGKTMTAGQTLYEASTGFETPWDKLSLKAQARWERWAGNKHYVPVETVNTGIARAIETTLTQDLNVMLWVDSNQLGAWGGPQLIGTPAIKFDAPFRKHQNLKFTATHLEATLSFDTLYQVKIPWAAVVQFVVLSDKTDPTEAA